MNEENIPQGDSEVTETPAPAPGTAEYNTSWLLGVSCYGQRSRKFMVEDGSVNMEAFAKSFLELENKLSADTANAPVEVGDEQTPSDPVEEGLRPTEAVVEELRVLIPSRSLLRRRPWRLLPPSVSPKRTLAG